MTSFEMPKTYDPSASERRIYDWWESAGYFKPEIAPAAAEPFVISIPPPNITGELHLGHAMFVSLEDLMIRYKRMRGYAALWVPGYDHAGIATQLQVEKMLGREGIRRQDLGREEFLRRTWEWKEKYGGHIVRQLRRLGASCDWDRLRFTMDEGLTRAVREAFVRLWRMGLIYRGEYLINWSPGLQTAVSDLEVEYTEEDATLYYFKYPIAGASIEDGEYKGYIPVATTRPETILGDTAVAVHPDDERYKHLIGATCLVPALKRTIPVIHDTYVDMEFGTGALKITPGHDPNDFVIGQRHGLSIISVLDTDAKVNAAGGPYAGLDRFEARKKLWADMEAAGLTIRTEKYRTQVPRSQRGGEIVEPMVSTQWFVKMKPMADMGLESVRSGRIQIIPERFTKVYYNWLENIRDWCISRQLWWGHRIPAWHCADCRHITVAREDPDRCEKCGSPNIEQDGDVLDTWFSSGLWPFSTLGWPDDTADLRRFYPTTVMETGYDILFFWVARMIMQGLMYTNDIPFETVYLHGLVRDDQGRKMSKTTGNVLDPLALLDGASPAELSDYVRKQYPEGIAAMGADALRFTLLTGATPGNDMNLSLQRVEGNRNFTNKIWNATRYILSQLEGGAFRALAIDWEDLALPERWILSRLSGLITEVTRLMDTFQFGEAGRQVYDFFWSEFCDWYLEISKIAIYRGAPEQKAAAQAVLVKVLDESLRLLHPFIPFVTEETWGYLKQAAGDESWPDALIIAPWPRPANRDESAEADMALIMDMVRAIRNARAEYDVKPGQQLAANIAAGDRLRLLTEQSEILRSLARLDPARLTIAADLAAPAQALTLVTGAVTTYLPLTELIDLDAERGRLGKELAETEAQLERSRALLEGPFAARAPAAVVQRERDKLVELAARADRLRQRLAELTS
ncbi:MAG: valine--tRNA ligase [Anaerolineae bacterium]|jgi:valyl-tRNA synthetase|nr:valine--tRNA ligase [Anaerolineae bacterium]